MGNRIGSAADAMLERLRTTDIETQSPLCEWLEALAFTWAMSGAVASIRIVGRGLPLAPNGRRAALAEVERALCGIAALTRRADVVLSVKTVGACVRIVVRYRLPTGTRPGARTVRDVIDVPVGVPSGASWNRTSGSVTAMEFAAGAASVSFGARDGALSIRVASVDLFGVRS